MPGRADKLFAPFEGTRDPFALAIVRVVFFVALAIHFAPSLIWLDIGYGHGAVRADWWNHWLYTHLYALPAPVVRVAAVLTLAACVAAAAGLRPRIMAAFAFVGCYTFASWNGVHVQTLALIPAWAMLMLWAIVPARESRLLSSLLVFQILLAVFFSGVEKVLAGWPMSNEMAIVLAYPKGFIVRDWVHALPVLHGPVLATAFTWLTLVVELGAPVALLFRTTRVPALVVYELFFLGIITMLEVPPLFYAIFASVPLLLLDDAQLATARSWARRSVRRGTSSPA